MIEGNLALQITPKPKAVPSKEPLPDIIWSQEQHFKIIQKLCTYGCEYIKGREEYTLLKEVLVSGSFTQVSKSGKIAMPGKI